MPDRDISIGISVSNLPTTDRKFLVAQFIPFLSLRSFFSCCVAYPVILLQSNIRNRERLFFFIKRMREIASNESMHGGKNTV